MAHIPADERRKQFLEAASRVISSKGVAGATTRAIAEEAGAPLASLHYVFASKLDLLKALLTSSKVFIHEMLDEAAVPTGAGLNMAVRQLMLKWFAADRPIAFAQFEIILWGMRTESVEAELSTLYPDMIREIAAEYERAAAPHEKNIDFSALAIQTLIICDGIQFGMLCVGRDYVNEEQVIAMADNAVEFAGAAA